MDEVPVIGGIITTKESDQLHKSIAAILDDPEKDEESAVAKLIEEKAVPYLNTVEVEDKQ